MVEATILIGFLFVSPCWLQNNKQRPSCAGEMLSVADGREIARVRQLPCFDMEAESPFGGALQS